MNKLGIKAGAELGARHFDECMMPIYGAILEKSPKMEDDTVWITAGSDDHDLGCHPNFRALDFRCKNIRARTLEERRKFASRWAAKVNRRLGKDYDVIFESGGDNPNLDHIHAEYDKKGNWGES